MSGSSASKARVSQGGRGAIGILKIAAAFVSVCVVALVAPALWLLLFTAQSDVRSGSSVRFEVKPGESTSQIARGLSTRGVVGNANMFRLRARISGADGKLKPGTYGLATGMSVGDVLSALEKGPDATYVTVTIPEGFVIEQIASRFETDAGVSSADFLRLAKTGADTFSEKHPLVVGAYGGSLEGYLFPKTYEIRKGESAARVIDMMLAQFDQETRDIDFDRARRAGLTPQQVVVVASMIERESKLANERPLVSSVIYNRLRIRMLLKIDATIEYVLRSRKLRLTNRDLRLQTPYNTYTHQGLPPGPISSPGLKSIEAAADPADTKFIYYVLTGKDGSHTFTTNLTDFLVAKRTSKRVFGR